MSSAIEPPPAPPRRRRPLFPLPLLADSESRSIQVGIIGTVLIHLILLLLAPRLMVSTPTSGKRTRAIPRTFRIQLVPPPVRRPAPKPPMKFVEANPNAPENVPDHTNNFSFMNQQVAQPKPNPNGHSDMPALEGRKDIQSTQIVDGRLTKPHLATPVPPSQAAPPSPAAPRRQQVPLAGIDKLTGDNPDGIGNNVGKYSQQANPALDKVDGLKDAPLVDGATSMTPRIDPRHPQPRPTLEQNVRPAVFTENRVGTANIGPTAVDARWSNYGVYLQRMIETVQTEWDRILDSQEIAPTAGSQVSITFVMNSKGEITRIVRHEDHGTGASDDTTRSCMSAISNPAPYGPWTSDMIAVLGNEQEMTFTFIVY